MMSKQPTWLTVKMIGSGTPEDPYRADLPAGTRWTLHQDQDEKGECVVLADLDEEQVVTLKQAGTAKDHPGLDVEIGG